MTSVLFVDDDFDVLDGIRRNIRGRRKDWQIDYCTSGEHALQKMAVTPPDVLVTDLAMTVMQGDELIYETLTGFPNTAVIALSGNVAPTTEDWLLENGLKVLSKPCSLRLLIEEIEEVAGRAQTAFLESTSERQPIVFSDWPELEKHILLLTRAMIENGILDSGNVPANVLTALNDSDLQSELVVRQRTLQNNRFASRASDPYSDAYPVFESSVGPDTTRGWTNMDSE